MAAINIIPFMVIMTLVLSILQGSLAFRSGLSKHGSVSSNTLKLFPFGKSSSKPASAKPTAPKENVAFGSKSKPVPKSKGTAKPNVDGTQPKVDYLMQARRVTRWIMFPGVFSNWGATEERMKPTIRISRTLSAKEKQALRDRNPEMY